MPAVTASLLRSYLTVVLTVDKKLMQAHKYFACGSLVYMGMAIHSGHKIAPKKKKAENPEK